MYMYSIVCNVNCIYAFMGQKKEIFLEKFRGFLIEALEMAAILRNSRMIRKEVDVGPGQT